MVAVTVIMLFVGRRELLSGAFRQMLLLPEGILAVQILPLSVVIVAGLTLVTVMPAGILILIPPMFTEFEVIVKVTVLELPEQMVEGLTAKLT